MMKWTRKKFFTLRGLEKRMKSTNKKFIVTSIESLSLVHVPLSLDLELYKLLGTCSQVAMA